MQSKLDSALDYARQGWAVFPAHSWVEGRCTCDDPDCSSPAKHPLTTSGCKDATLSAEQVAQWWTETQGLANVAVATGVTSGVVVLDVDPKSGGLNTLVEVEAKHGAMPATPTVETGSGGRHYYFRYPTATKIGNRAGVLPGIDVRGDGGYVIAPPSDHASGGRYSWLVPPTVALADVPGWLFALMSTPAERPARSAPGMTLTLTDSPDLATAPGTGEGQRRDSLCRLVGAHLGRGEEPDAILALARDWANRCTPALPDAEVVKVVQSLAKKHRDARPAHAPPDPVEDIPLPQAPAWPALAAEAYHGPVGELVRLVEPHSEADPVGLLLTALVTLGNCIGRTPGFAVEGNTHHVNLFAVLVGESSRARKGTSLGRVMSLFDAIDPDWKARRVVSGLSSGEGLIWAVRDPIEGVEATKDKNGSHGHQVVVKEGGVVDKRLLVNESEFAQALRVLRREGNTLSPMIRQAWDEGNLNALTKNNQVQATDAHVSILGHITRPELVQYLDETDIFNGFGNRFLWAAVRRSKLLPDGGAAVDLQPIKGKLAQVVAAATRIRTMSRSPEARSLWWSVYPELTAERPGLYGAVTGRGEAQVLRLSMLYALLDGTPVIDVPHLNAALSLWRYCDASARLIFQQEGQETTDPLETALLVAIRRQPGVNRKGLHKLLGGHTPAALMVQALARLRDKGFVRVETATTGGRPAECWHPREQTNKGDVPLLVPPARRVSEISPEVVRSLAPPAASGVVRSLAPPSGLSLTDLFRVVKEGNGKLVRRGDRIEVDLPSGVVPGRLEAAVVAHRQDLLLLLPVETVPPGPEDDPDYDPLA